MNSFNIPSKQNLHLFAQHHQCRPTFNETKVRPPLLTRSYSTYGLEPTKFDPIWHHIISLFRSFEADFDRTQSDFFHVWSLIVHNPQVTPVADLFFIYAHLPNHIWTFWTKQRIFWSTQLDMLIHGWTAFSSDEANWINNDEPSIRKPLWPAALCSNVDQQPIAAAYLQAIDSCLARCRALCSQANPASSMCDSDDEPEEGQSKEAHS